MGERFIVNGINMMSLCLRCTLNEYNTLVWQEFKECLQYDY